MNKTKNEPPRKMLGGYAKYYFPAPSYWPIIGSIALFFMFIGLANWIHKNNIGPYLFFTGIFILLFMLFGWFGLLIREGRAGLLHNPQMDRSFRLGMIWFIFTEVMFFAAFFSALFYARFYAVPILGGGIAHDISTHQLLWPNFHATWPLLNTPSAQFHGAQSAMEAWGIPAINTFILLSSAVTITIAHWGLLKRNRAQVIFFQALTIFLGIIFLMMQAHEYWTAYAIKSLRLSSGIYGATFFILTGFHALHVTVGIIALSVILWRLAKGDFNSQNHFGFEAVSWYWHFVDVVWLALFIIVYWL